MATQREIKNRIESISNTKKITKTMDMVSTAKMKSLQQRIAMFRSYFDGISLVFANLTKGGIASFHNPICREIDNPEKILILQITGNRGLCGSFNINTIENTLLFKKSLEDEEKEVLIHVFGGKGIRYMNFMKKPMYKSALNPGDKITLEDATGLGNELIALFLDTQVHEVYISYSRMLSPTSQKPEIVKLLPISVEVENLHTPADNLIIDYIYEPDPSRILSYILPLYIKLRIYNCFLESSFSEYFARSVAMKNATDASADMISNLTISYNRARQANITNQIAEIVGGSAELE